MPDYSKGKIYRISAGDLTYYGSTAQPLSKRMGQHRQDRQRGKGCASCLVLQHDPEARIILVEDYPCENREQLNAREQHFIDNNECVNKQKAYTGLTKAEYKTQYRQDNAEAIKAYYQDNAEARKAYQAQYNQDNAEAIREYKSQYNQDNREAISARRNVKHTCECGGRYTHAGKSQHLRTKKHQEYLQCVPTTTTLLPIPIFK